MDDFSPIQQELLSSPPPMLFGVSETVDGWCTLEDLQRSNTLRTLSSYRSEVALWQRGLKLMLDGFEGIWSTLSDGIERPALVTQIHLLALEVSSAKAALDLTLAGYYSIAFAAVRHMVEASVQAMYLHLFPDRHVDWDAESMSPKMRNMVNQIKSQLKGRGFDEQSVERFETLYTSWALLSKGSHPTGTGLIQVIAQGEEQLNVVGPSYRPQFIEVAFDHGIFAMFSLLISFLELKPDDEEWKRRLSQWIGDRRAVREAMIKRLGLDELLGEGTVTSEDIEM